MTYSAVVVLKRISIVGLRLTLPRDDPVYYIPWLPD